MNEEVKYFLKVAGVTLIASIIGGLIGGISGGCISAKMHKKAFRKEISKQFEERNFGHNCHKNHDYYEHEGLSHKKHAPEFEGRFIEEDYIIIPKEVIKSISNEIKNSNEISHPFRPQRTR